MMLATQSSSWWPFLIVGGGGLAWTLVLGAIFSRYEKHDGPLSFAVIPVFIGVFALVAVVEVYW